MQCIIVPHRGTESTELKNVRKRKGQQMKLKIKESDMYPPIKSHFQTQGYEVMGEIRHCDIAMRKDNELIIIEMKLSFGMDLLYQAIDRQKITNKVYMAVPMPKRKGKSLKTAAYIAERLELGLIAVDFSYKKPVVYEIISPRLEARRNNKRKAAVLEEMDGRILDNIGGSTKTKITTAYKHKAIRIAYALNKIGEYKPSKLVKEYDCPIDTYNILYRDYYGWFNRVGKGLYALSDKGKKALKDEQYKEIICTIEKELNP